MAGVNGVLGHMVDDNRLSALTDLVAKRGLDLQFAAGLQSEVDIVADAARDPTVFGHARNRSKTHPRRSAHNAKNRRDRLDAADGGYILIENLVHTGLTAFPLSAGRWPIVSLSRAYMSGRRRQNQEFVRMMGNGFGVIVRHNPVASHGAMLIVSPQSVHSRMSALEVLSVRLIVDSARCSIQHAGR